MLILMKQVVQFHIYRDEEGGYVAESFDLSAVTQGETLDEIMANLQEIIELAMEGKTLENLGIAPNPTVLANIELETGANAKT